MGLSGMLSTLTSSLVGLVVAWAAWLSAQLSEAQAAMLAAVEEAKERPPPALHPSTPFLHPSTPRHAHASIRTEADA